MQVTFARFFNKNDTGFASYGVLQGCYSSESCPASGNEVDEEVSSFFANQILGNISKLLSANSEKISGTFHAQLKLLRWRAFQRHTLT